MEEFLHTFPMVLVPVILWTVWKVIQIENKLLGEIKEDVAELKTDMKWLVHFHQRDEK